MVTSTILLYSSPSDWLDMPPTSSEAPTSPIYNLKAYLEHLDVPGLPRDPCAQLQLPLVRKVSLRPSRSFGLREL